VTYVTPIYFESLPAFTFCEADVVIVCQQAQPETPTSPRQEVQVQSEASDGASKALEGEVHPLMTYQLHVFVEQKGRLPTDFAELARTRLDAVPRTPPGMTWAIDRVTQEVKLVKK